MKQIFDFYKKKKTLSWLIIVITSIIEPTLLIVWISLITYAFVKKVDLFSSKIDKKFLRKFGIKIQSLSNNKHLIPNFATNIAYSSLSLSCISVILLPSK